MTLTSSHDRIFGVVEADPTLKRRVVAMHHCFGGLVEEDERYEEFGSNVGRLVANDVDFDPITGIPRMSNISVRIAPSNA